MTTVTKLVGVIIGFGVMLGIALVFLGLYVSGAVGGGGSKQVASSNPSTLTPVANVAPIATAYAQATAQSIATVAGSSAPTTANQNASPGLYNIPPQPQIGHPSLYLETGVPCQVGGCTDVDAHTKRYSLDIIDGTTAIVGGFTVDGVSNGVYKAQAGPGKLNTTVTDGFVAITQNSWANAEFCFRVSQAVQFNWAHNTVTPLAGWTCPTTGVK